MPSPRPESLHARRPQALPRTCLATAIAMLGCGADDPTAPVMPEGADAHPAIVAQTAEFERRVYRVTDRVHVAVGFALANSILIEGDAGAVVVDVTESVETAREIRSAFEKITTKPIRALVYTHNHADHVFGARGFVPEGPVDVYAHETTNAAIDRVVNIMRPAIASRSARMFGTYLPEGPGGAINAGIGPRLALGHGRGTASLMRPNRTFRDEQDVEIEGVRMKLVHAPGETDDQIFVWLPDERVLLPGDNVYKAFPNLYTIRGTPYRDVLAWAHSIDAMRAFAPEHLVPSHTRPISGAAVVEEVLTAYRDAIQYVHDQTVRGMNQGLSPDELALSVELPLNLRSHPYLQELYGTVAWSVRSIYAGYLGWFGGDTATLSPASPDERAAGFAALAGGVDRLLEATRQALEAERYAWAAELAGYAMRAAPESAAPRRLKAQALRAMGRRSKSPNGRHYYLTQALELEDAVRIDESDVDAGSLAIVAAIPIGNFMAAMPVRLDAERARDVDLRVGFRFSDVGESFAIHVRRGVAELRNYFPEQPDVSLTTRTEVWKGIVTGQRNAAVTFASDAVTIEGSTLDLIRFLRLFR